ncbi:MAG: hypothetical protein WC182_06610 [Bacilli bacterium]
MWNGTDYYNRETLYEQVWAEPLLEVAKRYGVSDVAIAKTCRKMHIPLPGRGYWSKIQSGLKMKKVPLPPFDKCPVVRRMSRQPKAPEAPKKSIAERLVPEAFILEQEILQKEAQAEMKIVYRADVKLTNPYVLNTERKLQDSLRKKPGHFERGRCISSNDEAFEVSVGPDNITRALAILQILCDALDERGYPIGPKPKDPKEKQEVHYGFPMREPVPIYAKVLDTYIIFRITEKSYKRELAPEHRTSSYSTFEYVPSGNLCFEILTSPYESYARHTWQDGKNLKIEEQIHEFIINMIHIATMEKENAAQDEIRHKQWLIEEEKRREWERLQQMENSRIKTLVEETEKLVNIKRIKDYIIVITEEGKRRLGESYPESDFAKWVDWAEQFLEKNDCRSWKLPKFDLSDQYFFII